MRNKCLKVLMLAMLAAAAAMPAGAQFAKGESAPDIAAQDVEARAVDLAQLALAEGRKLVIVYFFTPDAEDTIAHKLRLLHRRYGGKEIEIVAVGLRKDAAALKEFSTDLGLEFHVVSGDAIGEAPWLDTITAVPLTLFVMANKDRTIERVLRGGGEYQANLIKEVAENFFRSNDAEAAAALLDESVKAGEDKAAAAELKGYVLAMSGKLDEAEAEFKSIGDTAGLAKVALERGDYTQALTIAASAPPEDAYAQTVAAEAHLRQGDVDAAKAAADKAAAGQGADWQKSEALTLEGRVAAEQGDGAAAVASYREAQALDPMNVVPLSNEAEVHRKEGKLAAAEQALQKAAAARPDDALSGIMLAQIRQQLEQQNDAERTKTVQAQIADLSKRFQEAKAAGAPAADAWTTRPVVLAFLPARQAAGVFFERAGADVAIQREIETRLAASGKVSVVDRQMLDQLLQELNLGSSELASADTQRRLGRVLSAGLLGVIEYAQTGPQTTMYLRLIDSETTEIAMQHSAKVDENAIESAVAEAANALLAKTAQDRELKGLVADASDPAAIVVNLGKKHGVAQGQRFDAIEDGDPVEAGGRIIAYRQRKIATLVVNDVQDDYSVCAIDGPAPEGGLDKETRIRAAQ